MFACKNCGGNVKYDIASGQLACEYCHSLFDPYAYEDKTSDAEVSKDFDATIFTCPQCGGEIISTDNTAAGFCSFCGASTVLYSRISKEHRPDYIIPFQKTKDDCKQAYSRLMAKAIFAPSELKDPKKIDSFRGIYMPYWTYYVTSNGSLNIPATKSQRRGDYIITDHFNLTGTLDSYYKGLSYDASSSFDDSISESLAPYDVKGMKEFTPAYLSGFYGDTADVDSAVYKPDAEETAFTSTVDSINKVPAFRGYNIKKGSYIECITKEDAAYAFCKIIDKDKIVNRKILDIGLIRVNFNDLINNILKYHGISFKYILSTIFEEKNYYSPVLSNSEKSNEILKYKNDSIESYYMRLKRRSRKRKINILIGKIILKIKRVK